MVGATTAAEAAATPLDGATLYATNQPCSLCTKMLVNAGVREFVVAEGYPDTLAREIMDQAEVHLRYVKSPGETEQKK